ncbi:AI-2E family transporter YdiK [Ramlibacter sp. USB13]|uniref:AI-2E family transporter YdiK n=1 Tax=Ramlibacter cellulosilyticus TaxID=2764187 RepID=A0A923MTD1_9BURK|nr:AI-2E family transporter YdiK [Ramlibacter cellulosilyticus]MBC5783814.1 AI-2E family transporter YdiK [Ramlibacter cellulosilyticus]
MTEPRNDLARIVLTVLFIGGLIGASFWILRPFLGATIWAVMIVVATWPMLLALQRRAGGRRWVAATIMSLLLLLVLVVPLTAAVSTLVSNADAIAAWVRNLQDYHLPPPPAWVRGLPLVGERAASTWQDLATGGFQAMVALVTPYAGALTRWLVAQAGGVGALFLQFTLTVIAAAVLYASGESAAAWALRFGRRLGGEAGENAIILSGQAIRGVAMGVVVTALVQTLVGSLGLLIAGVPFAALLALVMFLAAVAQIGAALVMAGPVIWLYWSGSPGWGTFLLVVTLVVATLDNVLRPILIRMGADLPLLLIFVGVIGGLVSFGLIGIFVGPVVLAVSHTLINAWMDKGRSETRELKP